jgi:transcriptional regulator of heat shock response
MKVEIVTAIIVAAVGLIGTLVAWLGHRVLRSNAELSARISSDNARRTTLLEASKQLAENRQEWINQLRNDMAEYFALTLEDDPKKKDSQLIYKVGMRIELRMNPADRDYEILRTAMHGCMETVDIEVITEEREKYIRVCQKILKREWEVLKKELGELPGYSMLVSPT